MPAIRLMTWNIEKLGRTKIQFDDLLRAIADVVVSNDVDVLMVQEINTTQYMHASVVAGILAAELEAAYGRQAQPGMIAGAGPFRSYALSPNTQLEFYGFFFRDTGVVAPATLTGPAPIPCTVSDLSTLQFTTQAGAGPAAGHFPLIRPDLPWGNQHHVAQWTGARLPCFGLLDVAGTQAANRYLGVVNCHLKPDTVVAPAQVRVLPAMSVLNGVGAGPALGLSVNGGKQAITQAVVTGDFNIDYPDNGYNPLTTAAAGRTTLGFTAGITGDKTHLYTLREYKSARPRGGTRAAAVHGYDNLFVGGGFAYAPNNPPANGRAVTAPRVVDVPARIQQRYALLNDSVYHYAELDQRGFEDSENDYLEASADFRAQLLDRDRIVNLYTALLGTRMISDHLPAIVELRLP